MPVSESGTSVTLTEIASLIASLHRAGTPNSGRGIECQRERITFIFDHWIRRHATRDQVIIDAVPVARLQRGAQLARQLATDAHPRVLLHGDLHPGNVLDGDHKRGLIAIDPRPCVGDAAVDAVDWVFWRADPHTGELRSRNLAEAVGVSHQRLWAWCTAFAALLAASEAAHGAPTQRVTAILAVAP